jgi:subtilisin family serine protease
VDPRLIELCAEGSPDDEVGVILRTSDPSAIPSGVRIVAQWGVIQTCRLRRGDIPRVREQTVVRSMKAARLYGPNPTIFEPSVGEAPGAVRRPGADLPTGEGVVIAHIDWGMDFVHPEFRGPTGQTRLLALWDQSAQYDPARPHRYGFGRIYLADEINGALATADPYAALGYNPAWFDRGGGSHGTATLGVSAGNGCSGAPIGLAPEANLIFVHLSTRDVDGPVLLGDSVALLEAFHFIVGVAGGAPVVINASLGRQAGEHTGRSLTEQGMDAFLLDAPGRAIVLSGGNYFDRSIHASGTVRPGEHRVLHLLTDAADRTPNELDVWYPGRDRLRVSVRGPQGSMELEVAPGEHAPVRVGERSVGNLYHRLGDPNNGDNQVVLVLYPTAPAGRWEIRLFGEDVVDGRFHAWIERDAGCAHCQSRFAPEDNDPTSTTGTICNGFRTIAVGAYDAHAPDRQLATFSSSGPTRDGRQKPDLVAPGVRVACARSHPTPADPTAAPWTTMSGTSLAAPHVTGTIALMFAAARRLLSIDETRRLLLSSVEPSAATASIGDQLRLGSGYLDTAAAVRAVSLAELGVSPVLESDQREQKRFMSNYDRRRSAPSALPFQFQIPLGTGLPGLAVPIGGAASPFALSIPLSSVAAPLAGGAPVAEPLAPKASTEPPSTAAAGGEPPVIVAVADAPGAALAERVLSAAELSAEQGLSSNTWLHTVLPPTESSAEASEATAGGAYEPEESLPSATTLFNAFSRPERDAGAREPGRYASHFTVLARPREALAPVEPLPGDLLVRVARGEGWGQLAVVASPGVYSQERLREVDLRPEGALRAQPGWYLHVVEAGARPQTRSRRFCRRLADASGNLLRDTLLLRPRESQRARPLHGASQLFESADRPTIREGSSNPAVREAQTKLNAVHARQIAQAAAGLPSCPLNVDGRFSDTTSSRRLSATRLSNVAARLGRCRGPQDLGSARSAGSGSGTADSNSCTRSGGTTPDRSGQN